MHTLFYIIFLTVILYLLFNVYLNIKNNASHTTEKNVEKKEYTPTEKFVLSIASLEHIRSKHLIDELSLSEYLKKIWNIDTQEEKVKEKSIYVLQQLLAEGSKFLLFNNIQFSKEVKVKDLVAFDASRFAELLFQLIHLNILEEEEAWGLLFLNAQRVQDSFENWEDFNEAYCKGVTLHKFAVKEEEERKDYHFNDELQKNRALFNTSNAWLEESLFRDFKIEN